MGLTLFISPSVKASTDSGSAKVEGNDVNVRVSDMSIDNSEVTPFAKKNVGGGEWHYGTQPHLVLGIEGLRKRVYSNYLHPTKLHSSTSMIGNESRRVEAKKGYWSRANAYGAINQTGYTYWNVIN